MKAVTGYLSDGGSFYETEHEAMQADLKKIVKGQVFEEYKLYTYGPSSSQAVDYIFNHYTLTPKDKS